MTEKERRIITDFANENPGVVEIKFINDDPTGVIINEIGEDGMMNYIFRVQSRDKCRSVILKYGETSTKAYPDEVVSLNRQETEYKSMVFLQNLSPEYGVTPYCFDNKHNVIAMEDLSGMEMFSKLIKRGDFDIDLARSIGAALGKISKLSLKANVQPGIWQEWQSYFGGEQRNELMEYFVRLNTEGDPITELTDSVTPTFRKLKQVMDNANTIETLRNLYHKRESFLHFDCHCNAIFVTGNLLKIFDFEFSGLGPSCADIATLATTSYPIWSCETVKRTGEKKEIIKENASNAFRKMIEAFMSERDDLNEQDKREDFFKELAFFCGITYLFYVNLRDVKRVVVLSDEDRINLMQVSMHLLKHYMDITTITELTEANFPTK